ncbi:polycomb group protein embryonic flower 2-like protein isoform X4 [Tanacetum coccineum]
MPGIPLVSREANYSRDVDIRVDQLSEEEQREAEESLTVYCKPIELYNILQRRAAKNPLFLERCLHYKQEEKHKRRVQVSISISGAIGDGQKTQSLFPLYIMLSRQVSILKEETLRSRYRFKRVCKLTSVSSNRVKFILPELNKLSAEVNSGSLAILLVSCADITNPKEIDLTKDYIFSESHEGYCSLGKIPIDFLHLSWEKSPNLSLGERVQTVHNVSMQSCYMKLSTSDKEKCLSFQFPHNSEAVVSTILSLCFVQVPVVLTAEELGAKDKSPYDLYLYNNIPTNSLPHVIRLRSGNVVFNYRYYNNRLQRTEAVSEHAERDIFSPDTAVVSGADDVIIAEQESAAQSVPGSNLTQPALLQFAKTRKLSIERSELRNQALLQKRHFFHSHRAQPMELEQVMAEEDSEDEVDDDVADLEDRRMLDDFLDVTQDEKHMMHLWNSFIRKQRVLADAHVPWACEAFSDIHGEELVQNPKLNWCWRVFMIKLWNHDLLDAKTMNRCHLVLDKYRGQIQSQQMDSAKSKD